MGVHGEFLAASVYLYVNDRYVLSCLLRSILLEVWDQVFNLDTWSCILAAAAARKCMEIQRLQGKQMWRQHTTTNLKIAGIEQVLFIMTVFPSSV